MNWILPTVDLRVETSGKKNSLKRRQIDSLSSHLVYNGWRKREWKKRKILCFSHIHMNIQKYVVSLHGWFSESSPEDEKLKIVCIHRAAAAEHENTPSLPPHSASFPSIHIDKDVNKWTRRIIMKKRQFQLSHDDYDILFHAPHDNSYTHFFQS